MNAVLNSEGFAVRINNYTNVTTSNSGILFSFTKGAKTYQYYNKYRFFNKDADAKYSRTDISVNITQTGYYPKDNFSLYLNGDITLAVLKETRFTSWEFAQIGDLIECSRLSPGFTGNGSYQFSDYYRKATYKFKKTATTQEPFDSISEFPAIDTTLSSPTYSVIEPENINLSGSFTSLFYAKNFGDHVGDWSDIDDIGIHDNKINYTVTNFIGRDTSKYQLAYRMTLICWKMKQIREQILSTIAIEDIGLILGYYYDKLANPGNATYANLFDNLTLVDRTVAELCYSWGEIAYLSGNTIAFDPILPTITPNEHAINDYYTALANFYNTLVSKNETSLFPPIPIADPTYLDNSRRIHYLLKIVPESALITFPVQMRLEWIDLIINEYVVSETDQRIIVRLLLSFLRDSSNNSDLILDYFLVESDGNETRFEKAYNVLNDARLERYPIINWFVEYQTNKMTFVYGLYELWKTSTYNFGYIPSGVTPNEDDLNPQSYWFTNDGAKYYPKYNETTGELISGGEPVLEFSVTSHVDFNINAPVFKQSTAVKYETVEEINGKIVSINQITTITNFTIDYQADEITGDNSLSPPPKHYGSYHLYQPLSLLGYEADLDLRIPSIQTIPAFLFYYANDYDKIKDFDFGLQLTVEVALEIGLFFTTGGIGALRHLRHLKHITKLAKVKRAFSTLNAADKVLFWRGLEGVAELASVSAGIMNSFFSNYLNTNNDPDLEDPEIIALNEKISYFFLSLTLVSAGGAGISRYRCVQNAEEVIRGINQLSVPHAVPQDVLDVISDVKNTALVHRADYRNKMAAIPPSQIGGTNNMMHTYDNLQSDLIKDSFLRSFKDQLENTTKHSEFWKKMNELDEAGNDAIRIVTWRDCISELRSARHDIDFLGAIIKINKSSEINLEIFKGKTRKVLKDGATLPYLANDYNWFGKGIHHKLALKEFNLGGIGKIKGQKKFHEIHSEYYKARVEVFNEDYLVLAPENGGWKVKNKKFSTFFPDSWSKKKVQEMIAYAYNNKVHIDGVKWEGEMIDGVSVEFYIRDEVLETAYPVLYFQ